MGRNKSLHLPPIQPEKKCWVCTQSNDLNEGKWLEVSKCFPLHNWLPEGNGEVLETSIYSQQTWMDTALKRGHGWVQKNIVLAWKYYYFKNWEWKDNSIGKIEEHSIHSLKIYSKGGKAKYDGYKQKRDAENLRGPHNHLAMAEVRAGNHNRSQFTWLKVEPFNIKNVKKIHSERRPNLITLCLSLKNIEVKNKTSNI